MALLAQEGHDNSGHSHAPRNTSISGFSRVYAEQRDDNLPEVYVDDTPQVISKEDSHAAAAFDEAQSPKFSVAYEDTSKTPGPPEYSASASGAALAVAAAPAGADAQPPKDQRICGIGRKTFFIILAILLIVVAAAVGGGVGGAVASSASKSGSSGDGDGAENGGPNPPPTSTSEAPSST